MRPHKPIGILLLLSLLMGLGSGCSQSTASPTTIRIGVALYQQDDTFISTLTQSLEQQAQELELQEGVKINLSIVDAWSNQASQNEQVDKFLSQNYDIICVNIVDRTAAAVIIDKAEGAGVPVIFFNREPVQEDLMRWDQAYYVGSPAAKAGVLQGEMVLEAWLDDPDSLDHNGDGLLQYVVLEGEQGHQDALLRTEYSLSTIQEGGITLEKLASETANWQRGQGADRMSQWLAEFGDQIELVLSNNDDMALGAIDACLAWGMSAEDLPFIVGVDATPPALEAMEAGTLQGTVRNDSFGQAQSILTLAYTLATGGDTSQLGIEDGSYIWQTYTAVTPEDAGK